MADPARSDRRRRVPPSGAPVAGRIERMLGPEVIAIRAAGTRGLAARVVAAGATPVAPRDAHGGPERSLGDDLRRRRRARLLRLDLTRLLPEVLGPRAVPVVEAPPARDAGVRGLAVGPEPSAVLANAILVTLDRAARGSGVRHLPLGRRPRAVGRARRRPPRAGRAGGRRRPSRARAARGQDPPARRPRGAARLRARLAGLLYHRGAVRTLYRASRVVTLSHPTMGEWILVDGRHIQRVGTGEPPDADFRVDLPGTTIVPGFIDSHVHLTGTGRSLPQRGRPGFLLEGGAPRDRPLAAGRRGDPRRARGVRRVVVGPPRPPERGRPRRDHGRARRAVPHGRAPRDRKLLGPERPGAGRTSAASSGTKPANRRDGCEPGRSSVSRPGSSPRTIAIRSRSSNSRARRSRHRAVSRRCTRCR